MKKNLTRFTLVTILCITVIFQLGCVSTPYRFAVTNPNIVETDKGLLVARVIDTTQDAIPINYLIISADNVNADPKLKSLNINSLYGGFNPSRVFASMVEPGEYSLDFLKGAIVDSRYYYELVIKPKMPLGTFSVKPGHITDLGTLIVYRKIEGDRYFDDIIRMDNSPNLEVLKSHYEFNNEDIKTLSWHETGGEEENFTHYVSLLQNPIRYSKYYSSFNKTLYLYTDLGVLFSYNSKDGLIMDALDTHLQLTDLKVNNKGDLFVGGQEGDVFWKEYKKNWKKTSLPEKCYIEKIVINPDGLPDVITSRNDQLIIYRATLKDNNIQWLRINQFINGTSWEKSQLPEKSDNRKYISNIHKGLKSNKGIFTVDTFDIDGQSYIAIDTFIKRWSPTLTKKTRHYFAYDPKNWMIYSKLDTPDFIRPINAGNLNLGLKTKFVNKKSLLPIYSFYRKQGDQWNPLETKINNCEDSDSSPSLCKKLITKRGKPIGAFSFASTPWFLDENNGVAAARFKVINHIKDHAIYVVETSDGGRSWSLTSKELPSEYCYNFVSEHKESLIVGCNGFSSDIYESKNLAENWNYIKQHQTY